MASEQRFKSMAVRLLAGWLALNLAACGSATGPERAELNVLLVVVDTLGAEHLGSYGGAARTPHLDRLAAEGLRFEQALATAPWTQPSIASLMTSLMPSQHGVERLGQSLGDEQHTLAEELQGLHGLFTQGVVSHVLLLPKNGYAQGFDGYDSRAAGGHDELSSAAVSDGAIEFIDAHLAGPAAEQRFFLFAHYFDPHYLYRSHPEFAHTEAYDGPIQPGMSIWELRDQRHRLNEVDLTYLRGLYHEELAFTDDHIGRLLVHLERRGLKQKTLVIFTADHGEEFMGHGWIGHTRTLYDELLRVPLIMRLPGAIRPGVVRAPVSLIDVAPTVLALLGAKSPSAWRGQSLLPLMGDANYDGAPRLIFSEVSYGPKGESDKRQAMEKRAHKTSVVVGSLKLIHDRLSDEWELYRRDQDPNEQKNLIADPEHGGASLESLKAKLIAFERSAGQSASAEVQLDPGELEELRKLGYLRYED